MALAGFTFVSWTSTSPGRRISLEPDSHTISLRINILTLPHPMIFQHRKTRATLDSHRTPSSCYFTLDLRYPDTLSAAVIDVALLFCANRIQGLEECEHSAIASLFSKDREDTSF